jgi:hypothetical protein
MVWWAFLKPFLPYAIGAALVGGVWLHGDHNGYNRAIQHVAEENKEAVDAAEAARARVRDCINRGMRWDTASGQCS